MTHLLLAAANDSAHRLYCDKYLVALAPFYLSPQLVLLMGL